MSRFCTHGLRSLSAFTLLTPVLAQSCSSPNATFGAGGGRKIALVIDSSGSNDWTDPEDLRITAAQAFTYRLTASSEAKSGGHGAADLLAVIDFDDTSKVAYPLGDPGNAAFDTINAFGGTFISGGVDLGLAELQRDGSPLGNRTGMIVLTDGEDAYLETLILSLNNATALGVRISFGFLQTPGSPVTPPAGLVSAILATGGTFSTIDSAAAQQYFIDLIIANGPTPVDVGGGATGPNGETSILPGLAVAHKLARDPGVYTYNAVAGERLNFTVQSLTNQSLAVALSGHGGADLLTATEGPSWIANVLFTPASDTALKLTWERIFIVIFS
ncbi:hypothetical protein BZA05DRAFT_423423 [Tricharina praecox]|uniref:uncharacterized protein n=1 Tax=Tricharina praecox TaxID=43433 RepID=UPI00221F4AB1|nr:uncharacterized protein BZA05DRAFT_423423 [Tricharina praecox]KAI5858881.1 hypothetical protein BZA05DRAFT_423423 [Tricharina praecox]